MKFSKTDLVQLVSTEFNLSLSLSKSVIDSCFDCIIKIAKNDKRVRVPDIGIFSYEYKEPNVCGRNPLKNEQLGYLVGGGYRLKCHLSHQKKIDRLLIAEVNKITGLNYCVIKSIILFIGKEIREQLNNGNDFIVRGFGTIKRRGNLQSFIFRCAPLLIIKDSLD